MSAQAVSSMYVGDDAREKAYIYVRNSQKFQMSQSDFNGGRSADDLNYSNCEHNGNNSLTYKAGSSHSHKFVDFSQDKITKAHFTDDDGIDGNGKAYFAVFLEDNNTRIVVEIT